METRSKGLAHGQGTNYRDLHEYGFPDVNTSKEDSTIMAGVALGTPNSMKTQIEIGRGAGRLDRSFNLSTPGHASMNTEKIQSEAKAVELEEEGNDDEIVLLRKRLDSAERDLNHRKKEAEKQRLQEELAKTEKEFKQFDYGKGEVKLGKKSYSEIDMKDLRLIKNLNKNVNKQLGKLCLFSDCGSSDGSEKEPQLVLMEKNKPKKIKKSCKFSGAVRHVDDVSECSDSETEVQSKRYIANKIRD